MKKIAILSLLISLLIPCFLINIKVDAKTSFKVEINNNNDEIVTDDYKVRYLEWIEAGIRENRDFYQAIFPENFIVDDFDYEFENSPSDYSVLIWDSKESFDLEVEVFETALYQITIEYYSLTNDIRPIEISLDVNGKRQYYQSGQISLETFWETPHEFNTDRYNNDIMPSANQIRKWTITRLQEVQNLYEDGLLFKLDAGKNTLTFNKTRGELLVGKIEVKAVEIPINYNQYLLNNDQNQYSTSNYLKEYEGELLKYKNSPSIQLGTSKTLGVTPFSLMEKRLNILNGDTYYQPGQKIFYEVEVPTTGYYNLSLKYLQKSNQDVVVYRRLLIDDELPFLEARQIPFKYSKKWTNYTLSNINEEQLLFYLEEGKHTITLDVAEYQKRDLYYDLNQVMRKLNNLVLEVNKLTGGTVDKNRDWDITTYLPNLENDLLLYAETIKNSYLEWQEINHSTKNTYISSTLKKCYEKLEKLALEPNKIPARIGQISGNSGSLIESLGLILPTILNSPLSIDKVYLHSEEIKLPSATANPFSSFWVSVKRFFLSFFVDSNISKKTSDTLEVWVARSRQYVDLMQRKADEQFSKEFGIKVNISMMPSQDKLILANSAGNQPDIAIGVDAWRPYEFAIRDAIVNLREFDNFSDVASRFARGGFLQLIYDEGVYALPDTQNFQLLFYRKDIMDNLGLPVPNTWKDVIEILPELQRYGMNFYVNLAGTGAFKGFGSTMPFIYQFGGSIYSEDAFSAAINDPQSIEAITFMTELFTVYALPVEVGSFYNSFRTGELPIGIGDFGMYVQLLHAAPEIAGLWEIAAMPGIDYDGVVNRTFVGAASSNMIFKDSKHQDAAWNFLEWWSRKDVQIDYAESLIATMGPSYMWNTATKEAFMQYSWDETHKKIILSQWDFAYDVPKIPGSYMLEREISNIWNKTVYQGINVRSAIEDGMIVANKEIVRKMIEFGYLDQNGKVLKPYLLPTIETIGWWIDEQ